MNNEQSVVGRMLNRTNILQRVSISTIADRFMVATRTEAVRRIPSVRGIEATPGLISRLFGRTSNFAIIPSTAGKEIQADNSNDSDLIGDPPPEALNQATVRPKQHQTQTGLPSAEPDVTQRSSPAELGRLTSRYAPNPNTKGRRR